MFVFGNFTKTVRIVRKEVHSDNLVFRLHYRLTYWFLLACSVLVSSRQFIKEHINCIADSKVTPVINTFCFFSSTFTVVKYHNESYVHASAAAHPGVGSYTGAETIVRHAYYQWVPFVLFFQAILFDVPHLIWKHLENRRLEKMVGFVKTSDLTAEAPKKIVGMDIDTVDGRNSKVKWLSTTYVSLSRLKVSRDWAQNLVWCEFLNVVNLLFQIWLVNVFLQGQFLGLGKTWWDSNDDALELVFPKVTKCTFHKYGPSGTIEAHDALCVMALNIINEKIYCLLWFWFAGLSIVTVGGLLWRLLTYILHSRSSLFNKFIWGEVSPGPALDRADLVSVTKNLCFSDWLFLYYLGKNMDSRMFRAAFANIAQELVKHNRHELLNLENSTGEDPKESESFC